MPAAHAASYYAATAVGLVDRPALQGDLSADVCIIGAGYTGLSAALHLAGMGRSVVVLEAERVGWGASGRNGGQLHSGQRLDQETLEHWLGPGEARALYDLAEEAKRLVRGLITDHAIACDWRDGLIHAVHKRRLVAAARREVEHLETVYGYQGANWLDPDQLAAAIGVEGYHGGWRDASAGHLHPLNYALGLAQAAEARGVRIFEASRALPPIEGPPYRIRTERGSVRAAEVIVAVNGYVSGLVPGHESRVMPMNNYIVATEPLGERLDRLIPGGEAVADSRFVVHYWRPSADGRLVFGGGETYSLDFPKNIEAFVRPYLERTYPSVKGVRIDHAWGGTLALSMSKLPVFARPQPGLYAVGGYTGHGIAIATLAGKLMAEAIAGDTSRFDVFARLPSRPFPGGKWLRFPTLVAAMLWYGLLDRL